MRCPDQGMKGRGDFESECLGSEVAGAEVFYPVEQVMDVSFAVLDLEGYSKDGHSLEARFRCSARAPSTPERRM